MAKILVALEEDSTFSRDLVNVAGEIFGDLSEQLFVAMLVKDMAYTSQVSSFIGQPAMVDCLPEKSGLLTEEDKMKAEVISEFEKAAKLSGVPYEIYNDFKLTAYELVKQSTYADLMILSYQIFYDQLTGKPDTSLLYMILKNSRCPVMIIPNGIEHIRNIIFTYDGKESSVFAIRAFNSIFGRYLRDMVVTVLTVSPNKEEEIKNEKFLLDLVQQYYSNVGLQLLTGSSTSREILNYAASVDNPLVIMGAYGRSTISNLIIPSVANRIIQERNTPLFIAHR